MKKILLILLITFFIFNCENSKSKKVSKNVNEYENLNNIDSLIPYINKMAVSNDTIFLGFRMGMNKTEFKNHVQKLRKEGKEITYKTINKEDYKKVFGVDYSGNGSYIFTSPITRTIMVEDKTKLDSGIGTFGLLPLYNDKEGLVQLIIVDSYNWDTSCFNCDNWLINKSSENYENLRLSKNKNLKNFLILNNQIISTSFPSLINNNVLLIKKSGYSEYISKKAVFRNILLSKMVAKIADEKSNDITF